MSKNQYEEALFKCEDDRFEIDMVWFEFITSIIIFLSTSFIHSPHTPFPFAPYFLSKDH